MQEKFMNLALKEAKKALRNGEVPVGAVIVKDGIVLSKAHNMREKKQNALCHAEILAINKACKKLGTTFLTGCQMFVTLEPCPMCSGAIVMARLDKLVFACSDEHYGCAGSACNLLQDKNFEHIVEVESGVFRQESKAILQSFFEKVREKNKLKTFLCKFVNTDSFAIDENGLYKSTFMDIPVVSLDLNVGKNSPQKVVGIVEKLGSFYAFFVVGGKDYSCQEIANILKLPYKIKVRTKGEIKIIDKINNKN